MRERTAKALSGKARRRDADGGRAKSAEAAWARLVEAGDSGDETAVIAAWEVWLSDMSQELPSELARWPLPSEMRGKVPAMDPKLSTRNRAALLPIVARDPILLHVTWSMAIYQQDPAVLRELASLPVPDSEISTLLMPALRPDVSPEIRAILGEVIPEKHVTARNPSLRARYFLMTGQYARYRALDPDGSLFAAACQGVDERVRAALREAIVRSADPDLIRVLSATRGNDGRSLLTTGQRDHLVRELAGQADWEKTWRLATGLPLADAVPVARELTGRWSPADPREQQLLALLAAADPARTSAARDTLAAPAPVRLDTPAAARSCSFSADGRWAVVTVLSSGRDARFRPTGMEQSPPAGDMTVDWLLFELPKGNPVARERRAGVLFDARLADRWENRGHWPAIALGRQLYGLHEAADKLTYPAAAQQVIMPYPGGFVREDVILPGRGTPPPYQGGLPHDGTLTFFDAGGRELAQARMHRQLGLPDGWHYGLTAVHQESGRLLLNSGERAWLLDRWASRVLASTPPDTFIQAADFWDADHLVMVGSRPGAQSGPYLRMWVVRGDTIEIEAERPGYSIPFGLGVFPARGEIATVDLDGRLQWVDGATLTEIGVPRERVGTPFWYSLDGRAYAYPAGLGVHVFIDTYPARVAGLAYRPLGEMTQADLAAVTEALRGVPRPEGRPFLELLRDYLSLRFGTV